MTGPFSSADRILLVDDHAISQRFVGGMLAKLGLCVDVVVDGAEALKAAARTDYRAILMDCQIPMVDVDEVMTGIRRREGASRHTPVIGVANSMTGADRQRSLASGMDGCLTKPFDLEALTAAVGRWMPTRHTPPRQYMRPEPRSPLSGRLLIDRLCGVTSVTRSVDVPIGTRRTW